MISRSNNVLIINHCFPPDQGVANFRVTKFTKYLTRLGWEVNVLTRKNQGSKSNELTDDVSGINVINRVETLSSLAPVIKSNELQWIGPLVGEAIKMVQKHNIDVILHSAPDFMPLSSIIPIKKVTGVPYVIDLRDPWSIGPSFSEGTIKGKVYNIMTNIFEPRVFNLSSRIILNNKNMLDLYSNKYPSLSHKMDVITNGYDSEDYNVPQNNSDGFTIVYPGKFRDNMDWFFSSFSKFIEDHPDTRFIHFGNKDDELTLEVMQVVNQFNLNDCVEFRGYVNRSKVISVAKGANIGLAVTRENDSTHVPTKIYDFMGCGIPILAIDTKTGATNRLLNDIKQAKVISRKRNVGKALEEIYDLSQTESIDRSVYKGYSRKELTKRLSHILEKCIH